MKTVDSKADKPIGFDELTVSAGVFAVVVTTSDGRRHVFERVEDTSQSETVTFRSPYAVHAPPESPITLNWNAGPPPQ
jgi:hypothetical protein